ncbi:hypothetical protein HID58_013249 [Brassica napus]|uniref:Transposase-associated domain-containing protein n=1 Tax=Brassica napus TaxID=3708 RepID=A0ABQ8E3C3_BRANA|nr:hypothetical protein HID58_013249 [Brassica napus]
MDKSWINKSRLSQDYRLGVKNFLDFAFGKSNAPMVKCPCTRCSLAKSKTREDIEGDLICHGFLSSYTSWIVHGEDMCVTENARVPSDSAHVELDSTFNLLDDIFPDISANMNEEHEEGSPGQPMDTDRPSASSGNSKKREERQQAHRHILVNCQLLDHLREKYKNELLTKQSHQGRRNRAIDIDRENGSDRNNDVNLLPINYSDWRMVNPHIKNKVWEVIQSKFWFDDPATRKVFVMSALGSRCKDVKLRLWKEYKRDSLSETLLNRPENVPENQWGHFVHMRFTEKWKTIKTGKRPCRAEFFIETRTKPNGSFVCEEAKTRAEKLTTLLGQKSHVTNNAIASLDDEYAQVFGPERPGRIENSEMVIDLKSQVKELSDQVKGMTTFIQQVIGTSTGEQARVWASSFAVAFVNIPNPAFANVPSPPNPNQERSDDAVRD